MLESILNDKKVFIFDLDGTLIDSVGIWNEIDQLLIKQLVNVDIDEETINHERDEVIGKSTSKDPYIDYVAYLVDKYHLNMSVEDAVAYRVNLIDWYLINKVKRMPQALNLISLLREHGLTLILATSTSMRCIELYAKENENTKLLDFETFDLILTMEDVKKLKPNPEIHLKAMNSLDFSKEEAVIIEDSVSGCMAAKNAGIDVIAVKEKHSNNRESEIMNLSTCYIDSLKDICDFYIKIPLKSRKKTK